jgi:hypothetical protein
MGETFRNFKPLDDVFLLSEHKAAAAFTDAAHGRVRPEKMYVSPGLLKILATKPGGPSGRPGF